MNKARLTIIVLLLTVTLVALVGGAWLYLRPAPEAPPAPPPRAKAPPPKPLPVVLTASTDLPLGSLITANDMIWSPLKNGAVLSAHMLKGKTKPEEVIGAVVRRAVYKGMPLTWSSIVRPGQYGFLAAALRPNYRAVTILVNRATSQAGLIYPGDRVDVILTVKVTERETSRTNTYTGTILEDIRVVAVNRQVESTAGQQPNTAASRNGANTVTLEVRPAEAERLVLAVSRGDISLAMRSLTDDQRRANRTPTGFEHLLSLPSVEPEPKEAPPEPEPPPPPVAAPPPPEGTNEVRVQIFRGTAHQEVVLKK